MATQDTMQATARWLSNVDWSALDADQLGTCAEKAYWLCSSAFALARQAESTPATPTPATPTQKEDDTMANYVTKATLDAALEKFGDALLAKLAGAPQAPASEPTAPEPTAPAPARRHVRLDISGWWDGPDYMIRLADLKNVTDWDAPTDYGRDKSQTRQFPANPTGNLVPEHPLQQYIPVDLAQGLQVAIKVRKITDKQP